MKKVDHGERRTSGEMVPANSRAAEVSIRIGRHAALDARVTSAGLLSAAVLVSGILLSTAVIVVAAGGKRRKAASG